MSDNNNNNNNGPNSYSPPWVQAIATGNWDAAEQLLGEKIIAQAGPAYQQMKQIEDMNAVAQSRGTIGLQKANAAYERVAVEDRKGLIPNPDRALNRFAEVLDEEVRSEYFAQRRAMNKRNKGLDNVG